MVKERDEALKEVKEERKAFREFQAYVRNMGGGSGAGGAGVTREGGAGSIVANLLAMSGTVVEGAVGGVDDTTENDDIEPTTHTRGRNGRCGGGGGGAGGGGDDGDDDDLGGGGRGDGNGGGFGRNGGGGAGGDGGGDDGGRGDGGRGRGVRQPRRNQGQPHAGGRPRNTLASLAQSSKVIKIKLSDGLDIVSYVDAQSKLQNSIEEFYSEEDDEFQIKVALLALGENLRTDADFIFSGFRELGHYSLEDFFTALFKLSFPAPLSTLDLGFRKLTQNYPTKSSIVEYSRKFKTFVRMLGLNLETQINRFLDGLADGEVRMTLRKNNLEEMDFRGVVTLAMNIQNNLSLEKTSRAMWGGYREEGEGVGVFMGEDRSWAGEDGVNLVMGIPLKRYLDEATRWGLDKKCFNCFNEHSAQECKRVCRFCSKQVQQAKHYSLLCPKRPRDFRKYMVARGEAQKRVEEKRAQVKLVEDSFITYEFGEEEFD